MLLERQGQVVTRDELHKTLWSAHTFVDFERGLNKAINRLREALEDSVENPRFIETLPKRGYRFITLDEDLKDGAYFSADTFTGTGGISWIHRWAITRGVSKDFFKGEPTTPEFVMKLAGVTSE